MMRFLAFITLFGLTTLSLVSVSAKSSGVFDFTASACTGPDCR